MPEEFDNSQRVDDIEPEEGAEPEEPKTEDIEPEEPEEGGEIEEPKKFEGKSREEVIKSYTELEKLRQKDLQSLEDKAKEKAKELAEQARAEGDPAKAEKVEGALDEIIKDINDEIEKADYARMDPKAYGKWLLEKVRKIAETVAEEKVTTDGSFRDKIRGEVSQVKAEFPVLGEQTEQGKTFRELVLDLVSAAKSRGETLPLREAVIKATKVMGITGKEVKKEGEKKPVQKPKAIEKSQPVTLGKDDDEEEKVKKGILGAGSTGGLGGL